MIGIKDIDRKISDYLKDEDVFSLILVNKYYHSTFDDQYWRRRLIKNFSHYLPEEYNIYNESWKKFYLMIGHFFRSEDYYKAIKFSIEEDRLDLLEIIHKKYDFNFNIVRDWYKRRESYIPLNLCVENDSLKCFKYIYKKLDICSLSLCLSKSIDYHSHKIAKYLKRYLDESHIMAIFYSDCRVCYENLKDVFYKKNIINNLHYHKTILNKLLEKNSINFSLFIKNISYHDLLKYKNTELEKNHYDVAKCLTKYTSILN